MENGLGRMGGPEQAEEGGREAPGEQRRNRRGELQDEQPGHRSSLTVDTIADADNPSVR